MKQLFPILPVVLFLWLTACDSNRIYRQAHDFDQGLWHKDSIPAFTFRVEDTAPKNLLLHLRNSIAYPWQNIYLTYYLEDSTGRKLATKLINIPLFDSKTGVPKGKGSSIYQHEVSILENHRFPATGSYTFKVAQYMRALELKEILSVGVRVETSSTK